MLRSFSDPEEVYVVLAQMGHDVTVLLVPVVLLVASDKELDVGTDLLAYPVPLVFAVITPVFAEALGAVTYCNQPAMLFKESGGLLGKWAHNFVSFSYVRLRISFRDALYVYLASSYVFFLMLVDVPIFERRLLHAFGKYFEIPVGVVNFEESLKLFVAFVNLLVHEQVQLLELGKLLRRRVLVRSSVLIYFAVLLVSHIFVSINDIFVLPIVYVVFIWKSGFLHFSILICDLYITSVLFLVVAGKAILMFLCFYICLPVGLLAFVHEYGSKSTGHSDNFVGSLGNLLFEGYGNDVVHQETRIVVNRHGANDVFGLHVGYGVIPPVGFAFTVGFARIVVVNASEGTCNGSYIYESAFLYERVERLERSE